MTAARVSELTSPHVSSWYSIPEAELTRAGLEEYQAAGYTVFQTLDHSGAEHGWRPYSRAGNLEALRLCAELGLRCLVVDDRVYRDGRPYPPDRAPAADQVAAVKRDYAAHPAFEAFMLYDEPSPHMYPALARTIDQLRPSLSLVPMFPMHADPRFVNPFEGRSYEEYLSEHVQVCRPGVLSYDYYPFFDPPGRMPEWVLNFEIASRVAGDLPLWYYAGVCDPGGPAVAPTLGRLRLQMNMAIAYGATGILQFTYAFADEETRRALAVVNREARGLLAALVGVRRDATWHGEPLPRGGSPPPADLPTSELTTAARFGSKLLILNRDSERDRTVRVGSLHLDLPAGTAALTEIDAVTEPQAI